MSGRRILSAQAYDDDPDQIIVELEGGAVLKLELTPKLREPLFAEISTLHLPRTDGSRVYWSNGASLSFDELMALLTDEAGSEKDTANEGETKA